MRLTTTTQSVRKRNGSRPGAFTLVEVLVSMAIVGGTLVAFYAGISSGFRVVQHFRENLRCTQIMAEKMETIRLYTFDQISSNGFIPQAFTAPMIAGNTNASTITFTGAVSIAGFNLPNAPVYSNDLMVVTVEVNWVSGQVLRQRSMQTLVARNGLQTYIY